MKYRAVVERTVTVTEEHDFETAELPKELGRLDAAGFRLVDLKPARGRIVGNGTSHAKAAPKKRRVSPAVRAQLAENLKKARAAKAKKARAARR